ncbi:MAG: lysophospholipid acyltransferase family protein [Bacteroidota bacterium]|nr:lysophospholipid acyltransferase family protein [Bacteroidota bacterium]MDP4229377.1 lysophospholipid acyltransferase family protein [Bacteroidota bacterium]MDP4235191.1 lysophospholipid acyltransferase family protein [Bacteroidota bacterium]
MIRSIVATIIFLLVTIVLSILSIPAALFDRSGSAYLWLARFWSKIFLFLYGVKLHISGSSHIRKSEHYVYVANHSSYTDIPILLAAIPDNVRLILRHTLTRIPIWGTALLLSPMIIINRSNSSKAKKTLNKAIEIIRSGASIMLFPEGTRTHDGEMQPFKRGAFHMAYSGATKIIPVAIKGSFELQSRTQTLPSSNRDIYVSIGTPLEASSQIENDRSREMDLMQRAENAVREMLGALSPR